MRFGKVARGRVLGRLTQAVSGGAGATFLLCGSGRLGGSPFVLVHVSLGACFEGLKVDRIAGGLGRLTEVLFGKVDPGSRWR